MYKLAIVSTHPIQYHTPWFQALNSHPEIDLTVYFCHNATPQEQAAAGFGVQFEWDTPLLQGYCYKFLENVAREPSISRFHGLDVPEISKIIHEEQFDAVLVFGWTYKGAWQTFLACWQNKVPLMVRGDSHLHTKRSIPKKILKYPFYRLFLSRMDAALAVGKWSSDYFRHYGVTEERIFLVPHVIDQDRFWGEAVRVAKEKVAIRAEWNIMPEAVVYLFCGKLNDQKRPLDFVQAMELAYRENPAITGLVVGDGKYREACESLAREENIPVVFTGFVNQTMLPRVYAASDMIVLPSSSGETWGLVINEAMFSGISALVSDQVGCGPDLIEPGRTGDTFPMGDVNQLAEAMVRYAEHPEKLRIMGAQARENILKEYSMEQAVDGVLKALRQMIKR